MNSDFKNSRQIVSSIIRSNDTRMADDDENYSDPERLPTTIDWYVSTYNEKNLKCTDKGSNILFASIPRIISNTESVLQRKKTDDLLWPDQHILKEIKTRWKI